MAPTEGNMNLVVLCTLPNPETAKKIAQTVVHEGLAAFVNIVPGLTSVYRWQGEIVEEGELLLIVKTREERYPALESRIKELRPYSVPEIIVLPIQQGSKAYLDWIVESTK